MEEGTTNQKGGIEDEEGEEEEEGETMNQEGAEEEEEEEEAEPVSSAIKRDTWPENVLIRMPMEEEGGEEDADQEGHQDLASNADKKDTYQETVLNNRVQEEEEAEVVVEEATEMVEIITVSEGAEEAEEEVTKAASDANNQAILQESVLTQEGMKETEEETLTRDNAWTMEAQEGETMTIKGEGEEEETMMLWGLMKEEIMHGELLLQHKKTIIVKHGGYQISRTMSQMEEGEEEQGDGGIMKEEKRLDGDEKFENLSINKRYN